MPALSDAILKLDIKAVNKLLEKMSYENILADLNQSVAELGNCVILFLGQACLRPEFLLKDPCLNVVPKTADQIQAAYNTILKTLDSKGDFLKDLARMLSPDFLNFVNYKIILMASQTPPKRNVLYQLLQKQMGYSITEFFEQEIATAQKEIDDKTYEFKGLARTKMIRISRQKKEMKAYLEYEMQKKYNLEGKGLLWLAAKALSKTPIKTDVEHLDSLVNAIKELKLKRATSA